MGLDGQRIEVELPSGEAVTSESVRKKLQFRARMPLPAGRYEFKTVVRDGASGSVGTQQVSIDVPDFSGAASPSSLLMTTTARAVRPEFKGRKRERKAAVAEGDRGLTSATRRSFPKRPTSSCGASQSTSSATSTTRRRHRWPHRPVRASFCCVTDSRWSVRRVRPTRCFHLARGKSCATWQRSRLRRLRPASTTWL